MPVQLIKAQPNPATAQRVAEVNTALATAARSMAPAMEKATAGLGISFARLSEALRHRSA
ncbi:MAG: hypothetical protein HOV82_10165 [Streptomyces sp.]|nr:hypothetical protein [Streptomyces sp.]